MRAVATENGVNAFLSDSLGAAGGADGGGADGVGVFAGARQGSASTGRNHESATERIPGSDGIDHLDGEAADGD